MDINGFSEDPDPNKNTFEFDTIYEASCDDNLIARFNKLCKLKASNNIILLDWDDTILPTSWLVSECGIAIDSIHPPELTDIFYNRMLCRHDVFVCNFFDTLLDVTSADNIHILTNSVHGWVKESAKMYLPLTNEYIDKFKITATRMSGDEPILQCMKYDTIVKLFGNLLDPSNAESTKNIIAIGDSFDEINSINRFTDGELNIITKTIKLRPTPTVTQLMDELNFIKMGFNHIYNCICNTAIVIKRGLFDDLNVSISIDA